MHKSKDFQGEFEHESHAWTNASVSQTVQEAESFYKTQEARNEG